MRLCRYGLVENPRVGFYDEAGIIPLALAELAYHQHTGKWLHLPDDDDIISYLPPVGEHHLAMRRLWAWLEQAPGAVPGSLRLDPETTRLLTPVARPKKLLLLAGNYAEHVKERGYVVEEQQNTFPYVFMKPASTTLNNPGQSVAIPASSPDGIDWECELAVVMGRKCRNVTAGAALSHVAGYTVLNDISHRKYRPNPGRKTRERDKFFDWLHGKWFDGFGPCGPCVTSAATIPDPQVLGVKLTLNGEVRQNGTTAQMIFSVAEIIAFISEMMTLEPGDIISTGTPSGVGSATGTFLKPGDIMHASVEKIGTLITPMVGEAEAGFSAWDI